jgi:GntR family transcriptional regulator, transcriptional repressor for pyruvate dehydrogenase complex
LSDVSNGPPAARRSASEQVADDIRTFMQRERLQPGDRLGREEDLARTFGVSRPTLREALRLLSSAHLVRASKGPGGGIFVAATAEQGIALSVSDSIASMLATDAVDLDELLEARMLMEIPLAGLAAQRATEEDVSRLTELLAQAKAAGTDSERFRELDRELHRRITTAAGNRLSGAFMAWVVDVLQPSLQERLKPAVVESTLLGQHQDVLRAIERGDPEAAERAMREHLIYLRDLLSVIDEFGGDRASEAADLP